MARAIIIEGLRRSGTTVVWETFRQDRRNRCYDEPFHPKLWDGYRENEKGTWLELGRLWEDCQFALRLGLEPIRPTEELSPKMSEGQARYFAEILSSGNTVVVDSVRTWNRYPGLLRYAPDVVVVHLVRSPAAWAMAHMVPSGNSSWKGRVRSLYRLATLFRKGGFNFYHYEQIIDSAIATGHVLWRQTALGHSSASNACAVVKLLGFWWAATQITSRSLKCLTDTPVITATLEEFVREPESVVKEAYAASNWAFPRLSYAHVRSIREVWRPASKFWKVAFAQAGIPESLLPTEKFGKEALLAALEAVERAR